MAVLTMAMKAVLMNHSNSRGMVTMLSPPSRSLPVPLTRMIRSRFSRVGWVGIISGGSFTVELAGVSAVTKSQ